MDGRGLLHVGAKFSRAFLVPGILRRLESSRQQRSRRLPEMRSSKGLNSGGRQQTPCLNLSFGGISPSPGTRRAHYTDVSVSVLSTHPRGHEVLRSPQARS